MNRLRPFRPRPYRSRLRVKISSASPRQAPVRRPPLVYLHSISSILSATKRKSSCSAPPASWPCRSARKSTASPLRLKASWPCPFMVAPRSTAKCAHCARAHTLLSALRAASWITSVARRSKRIQSASASSTKPTACSIWASARTWKSYLATCRKTARHSSSPLR